MKFQRNNIGNVVYRRFQCDVCGYKCAIKYENGKEVLTFGDKPMEIYPFISLREFNGENVTLCSCPKCRAIQVLDQTEDDDGN